MTFLGDALRQGRPYGGDAPCSRGIKAHAPWTIDTVSVDHYENFPVASRLCPPRLRPPIVAIYRFARTADDIADEGDATADERLAQLARYRAVLGAVHAGAPAAADAWPQVFGSLAEAIATWHLPLAPLDDLLDAFMQDTRNPRYPDRGALLDYCRRSANPIGRLLLHLYGIDDAASLARSDDICTALQLINFWQDLSVDGPRGRHYVPATDAARHGVSFDDLAACTDSPAARALVRDLCGWAGTLMRRGAPLALRVPGRAGWELRAVVQGGLRILARIEALQWAALRTRPTLGAADLLPMAWGAVTMRAPRPGAAATADTAAR